MWKPNRDSNYWLRDHVNHNKFCFDINWTNKSTLNIPNVLFSKIELITKFYERLVSIYHVNCLLKGNVLAQNNIKFLVAEWKIVSVELSNVMLSENYFHFSNLCIFKYEIKEVPRSILRFAVE